MGIIFQICCGIITVLAYIFGTTYEEMNTYLFIYAQPAILLLSFGVVIGVVLFKLVRRFSFLKTFLLFLFGFLGLGYLAPTLYVWKRYSTFSAHDACVLAYDDLAYLGEITSLGYVGINLFLFIILFLAILGFNMISAFAIKKFVV